MQLICSGRCGGAIFRAPFAEVDLDSAGGYLEHRVLQPSFICLNCGSPALDFDQIPAAIRAEREEDEPPPLVEILCPVCESLVVVGEDRECPNCGAFLEEIGTQA